MARDMRPEVAQPEPLVVKDLRDLSKAEMLTTIEYIVKMERKTFPRKEAMDFLPSMVSKQNTMLIVVTGRDSPPSAIFGYALCVRWQKCLLLHKICVSAKHRGIGIGKVLLLDVLDRARRSGSRQIELWVDETNGVARALYQGNGFQDIERKENYYSEGRHAVKMGLDVPH